MTRPNLSNVVLREYPVPWRIGEHVAVIGDTGTGKTYLMSRLADLRNYVVMLRTKSDDIKFRDMVRVKDTRAMGSLYDTRLLITPPFKEQARIGADMMSRAWKQGGWTVFNDELFYITDVLRLNIHVDMLLTQGRSKKLSIVNGMQRPVRITRFAISQATHVFAFRLENKDAKFVAEATSEDAEPVMRNLQQFQFAHFHRPTRTVAVGNANDLGKIIRIPNDSLRRVS